ncbi:MAG: cytochrome ubiquinol oxidase subunit I [Deltaproteobacteria bacterium]|nr:cytochrome ubiquinol oxidase subunit I [Deltaproteobacteria bacterium]
MTPLFIARMQMAFTLGFHIIFSCLGIGLPLLMSLAEYFSLKNNDDVWKTLAKRWSKAFAVLFAIGAVSGTVLSFELGLLWPKFMGTFGGVIGLPFTLEGFAFFIEAIFAGIYLYSWDRLSPRAHWWTSVPIAIAGVSSAWFVVTANAWMNTPTGFKMVDGIVTEVDPIAAMLNPATPAETLHMIVAAYMVTGFLVASVYAVAWLKGNRTLYHKRALSLALWMGLIATPLQFVTGDMSGEAVGKNQPIKLAAFEGQFVTQTHAPLRIGGWPDTNTGTTRYALEIPGGLSWLVYGKTDARVMGLNDVPKENRPPVTIVHLAFQIMVAIGSALLFLSLWACISFLRKKEFPKSRLFLSAVSISGAAAVLALECGWTVTEVGRQPWIVYNIMKTADAVTTAPGIQWVFLATIFIYLVLIIGGTFVLRLLAKQPLPKNIYDA